MLVEKTYCTVRSLMALTEEIPLNPSDSVEDLECYYRRKSAVVSMLLREIESESLKVAQETVSESKVVGIACVGSHQWMNLPAVPAAHGHFQASAGLKKWFKQAVFTKMKTVARSLLDLIYGAAKSAECESGQAMRLYSQED